MAPPIWAGRPLTGGEMIRCRRDLRRTKDGVERPVSRLDSYGLETLREKERQTETGTSRKWCQRLHVGASSLCLKSCRRLGHACSFYQFDVPVDGQICEPIDTRGWGGPANLERVHFGCRSETWNFAGVGRRQIAA